MDVAGGVLGGCSQVSDTSQSLFRRSTPFGHDGIPVQKVFVRGNDWKLTQK